MTFDELDLVLLPSGLFSSCAMRNRHASPVWFLFISILKKEAGGGREESLITKEKKQEREQKEEKRIRNSVVFRLCVIE